MGVFRIALIEQGKKAARILQSEFKKSAENSVYYNIQDRPSVNVQVLRISSWLALPLLYPFTDKIQAPLVSLARPLSLRNFGFNFRSQVNIFSFSPSRSNSGARPPLALVHDTPPSDSSLPRSRVQVSPGLAVFS